MHRIYYVITSEGVSSYDTLAEADRNATYSTSHTLLHIVRDKVETLRIWEVPA